VSPAAAEQTPLPWYHSYGRADVNATCDAGWHPSYAMWPHDDTGGWVCDRTLSYNNATRLWGAS
jgi:hypothetical protein